MLIKCPECGKEVSDRADVCIHCGCPLVKRELIELNTKNNICCINGVDRDLTNKLTNFRHQTTLEFIEGLDLNADDGWILWRIMKEFSGVPLVFDSSRVEEYKQRLKEIKEKREAKLPHCPTCNSTNLRKISTTSKVLNTAAFGLLGTKRHKQWHCNNCGHEW